MHVGGKGNTTIMVANGEDTNKGLQLEKWSQGFYKYVRKTLTRNDNSLFSLKKNHLQLACIILLIAIVFRVVSYLLLMCDPIIVTSLEPQSIHNSRI